MAWLDTLSGADAVFQTVSLYLNTIVIVLVIILFGFIIGKIVESVLLRLLAATDADERLTRLFKARRNYARAIRRTIVRLIYLAAIIVAISYLSITGPVLYAILFCVIVVMAVSFVLAGIEVVPNLVAWSALRQKRFSVGDEVTIIDKTGVLHGTITDLTFLEVRLNRRGGEAVFVPNAVFLRDKVIRRRPSPENGK